MGHLLKDRVIVLIGGAGLLGTGFIKAILDEGGTVTVADLDEKKGRRVAESFGQEYQAGRVAFFPVDIQSKESLKVLIDSVQGKYRKIDAMVDCAYPRNRNYGKKFEDVSLDDFCENVNLHLGGYFHASQQFAHYFRTRGNGNIINIASIYGVMSPRFEIYEGTDMTMPVEYAAIKSAIVHLTKYMAKYFKGSNIRFNCISPGGILDGQPREFLERYRAHSLNKGMLDREDVAGTLVYLLSDLSAAVNGQNIVVDDGFSL